MTTTARNTLLFGAALAATTAAIGLDYVTHPMPSAAVIAAVSSNAPCAAGAPIVAAAPCAAGAPVVAAKLAPPPPPASEPEAKQLAPPPPPVPLPDGATEAPDLANNTPPSAGQ